MIVADLNPDRRPGELLDRVFPPEQSDDDCVQPFWLSLRPVPTPAGCSYPTTETRP